MNEVVTGPGENSVHQNALELASRLMPKERQARQISQWAKQLGAAGILKHVDEAVQRQKLSEGQREEAVLALLHAADPDWTREIYEQYLERRQRQAAKQAKEAKEAKEAEEPAEAEEAEDETLAAACQEYLETQKQLIKQREHIQSLENSINQEVAKYRDALPSDINELVSKLKGEIQQMDNEVLKKVVEDEFYNWLYQAEQRFEQAGKASEYQNKENEMIDWLDKHLNEKNEDYAAIDWQKLVDQYTRIFMSDQPNQVDTAKVEMLAGLATILFRKREERLALVQEKNKLKEQKDRWEQQGRRLTVERFDKEQLQASYQKWQELFGPQQNEIERQLNELDRLDENEEAKATKASMIESEIEDILVQIRNTIDQQAEEDPIQAYLLTLYLADVESDIMRCLEYSQLSNINRKQFETLKKNVFRSPETRQIHDLKLSFQNEAENCAKLPNFPRKLIEQLKTLADELSQIEEDAELGAEQEEIVEQARKMLQKMDLYQDVVKLEKQLPRQDSLSLPYKRIRELTKNGIDNELKQQADAWTKDFEAWKSYRQTAKQTVEKLRQQFLANLKDPTKGLEQLLDESAFLQAWAQVQIAQLIHVRLLQEYEKINEEVNKTPQAAEGADDGQADTLEQESPAQSEDASEQGEVGETTKIDTAWKLLHLLEDSNWNIDAIHNANNYSHLEQLLAELESSQNSVEREAGYNIRRRIKLIYMAMKIKENTGNDESTIQMLQVLAGGYRNNKILRGDELREFFKDGKEGDGLIVKDTFELMRRVGLIGLGAEDLAELIKQAVIDGNFLLQNEVRTALETALEGEELKWTDLQREKINAEWVRTKLFAKEGFYENQKQREKSQDRIYYVNDNLIHQTLIKAYMYNRLAAQVGGEKNEKLEILNRSMTVAENIAYATYEYSKWNREALFGDNVAEAYNLYGYRMGRFEQDRDRGPDITIHAFESIGKTFLEHLGIVDKVTENQRREIVSKLNAADVTLDQLIQNPEYAISQAKLKDKEKKQLLQGLLASDLSTSDKWQNITSASFQTFYLPYLTRVISAKKYILKTDWKPGDITEDLLHALVPIMGDMGAIDETGEGKEAALLFAGILDEILKNPRVLGWSGKSIWLLGEMKRMMRRSEMFTDEQINYLFEKIVGEETGFWSYFAWGPFTLARLREGTILTRNRSFWADFWEAFMSFK